MCKHLINSQVYVQAPCCNRWFECTECHDEMCTDHLMGYEPKVKFACKVCKKCFTRDFALFSEKDKYCSHCDTKWCMPAITPESKLEGETCASMDAMFTKCLSSNSQFYEL